MQNTKTRQCRSCKDTKPLALFYKSKYGTGGYFDQCKACTWTDEEKAANALRAMRATKAAPEKA